MLTADTTCTSAGMLPALNHVRYAAEAAQGTCFRASASARLYASTDTGTDTSPLKALKVT
jgi:hypothetical protein